MAEKLYARDIYGQTLVESYAYMEEAGIELIEFAPGEYEKVEAAGAGAYEEWLKMCDTYGVGAEAREYLADCIDYRDWLSEQTHFELGGKRFEINKPFGKFTAYTLD